MDKWNFSGILHVLVNARLAKKQKSPQRSSDISGDQKVEGLRNRVKKSTIEAAIELRAKRDIPSASQLLIIAQS